MKSKMFSFVFSEFNVACAYTNLSTHCKQNQLLSKQKVLCHISIKKSQNWPINYKSEYKAKVKFALRASKKQDVSLK